ncbi:hypothetical protein LguiB_008486 [Lonicera macranthoides]
MHVCLSLGSGFFGGELLVALVQSLILFAITKHYMCAFGTEVVKAVALSLPLEEAYTTKRITMTRTRANDYIAFWNQQSRLYC